MPQGTVGESDGSGKTVLPLVGRAEEWDRLAGALAAAAAGRCRTVLIEGEAGIGKSRLVEELQSEARSAGFCVLAGRADQLDHLRPFAAVADALASRPAGVDAGSTINALLRVAGSTGSGDFRLIDTLVDVVEELAVDHPVALVLEDLHWADAATISAVRLVGRRLGYLPILVVGTYRPHPLPPELPRLIDAVSREGGITVVLHRLTDEAVTELVGGMLGAQLAPGLSRIVATASGNPLFVTELVRGLQDEGLIGVTDGVAETDLGPLPPTLRLTILRRLSFLPAATLEALRAAAVLGSVFTLEEVAAVMSRSVPEIVAAVEPAIRSKVLGERGPALAFRHDLIQEAIYDDIPAPLRASMHLGAARTLKALGVSPTRAAEHLLRGTHSATPESIDMLTEAASTVRRAAPALSIELNQRALDLLPDQDPRKDDIRVQMLTKLAAVGRGAEAIALSDELLTRQHSPRTDGAIRLARYAAKQRQGRSGECIPELLEMADDPRYPGELRRLAQATAAAAHVLSGQVAASRPRALRAVAEAREHDDDYALTMALSALGACELAEGRIAEGVRHLEEVLDIHHHRPVYVVHPHSHVAAGLVAADRLDEAWTMVEAGRRRDREAGEIPSLATHAHVAAMIRFIQGSWDDAVVEAHTGRSLVADGVGSSVVVMLGYVPLAQIMLRRGELDEAERIVAEGRQLLEQTGPGIFMDALWWADALCREARGDFVGATDTAREGWEIGEFIRFGLTWRWAGPDLIRMALADGDEQWAAAVVDVAEEAGRRAQGIASMEGAALRCRGLLSGDADVLVAAVEAYGRGPAVHERALASEDAAVRVAELGRTSDARGMFSDALRIYEELGAAWDTARCTAAMRRVGLRPGSRAPLRRAVSGWEALTPKEREVAKMAAEGLTNPQIAERLFVSKYTVMTHLSHVFGKLGISSRVELAAAIAARQVD